MARVQQQDTALRFRRPAAPTSTTITTTTTAATTHEWQAAARLEVQATRMRWQVALASVCVSTCTRAADVPALVLGEIPSCD